MSDLRGGRGGRSILCFCIKSNNSYQAHKLSNSGKVENEVIFVLFSSDCRDDNVDFFFRNNSLNCKFCHVLYVLNQMTCKFGNIYKHSMTIKKIDEIFEISINIFFYKISLHTSATGYNYCSSQDLKILER